jgi:hypothetical protein
MLAKRIWPNTAKPKKNHSERRKDVVPSDKESGMYFAKRYFCRVQQRKTRSKVVWTLDIYFFSLVKKKEKTCCEAQIEHSSTTKPQ